MAGDVRRKAKESAERCVPFGIQERPTAVRYFTDGYMAGHAAHTRWMSKRACDCCGKQNGGHYSDCILVVSRPRPPRPPLSREYEGRDHRGITSDWHSVCTDNDCWCWGSDHHNPRATPETKTDLYCTCPDNYPQHLGHHPDCNSQMVAAETEAALVDPSVYLCEHGRMHGECPSDGCNHYSDDAAL